MTESKYRSAAHTLIIDAALKIRAGCEEDALSALEHASDLLVSANDIDSGVYGREDIPEELFRARHELDEAIKKHGAGMADPAFASVQTSAAYLEEYREGDADE
jgi:hypothetical protein